VRNSEGPGVNIAYSRTPIWEYAMRDSPGPYPTLLVFTITKYSHAVMVEISTVRISEGPGVNIAYSRTPICEYTMRGSPGPYPTLIVFKNIKCSHAVMVEISTVRISQGPG